MVPPPYAYLVNDVIRDFVREGHVERYDFDQIIINPKDRPYYLVSGQQVIHRDDEDPGLYTYKTIYGMTMRESSAIQPGYCLVIDTKDKIHEIHFSNYKRDTLKPRRRLTTEW